MDERKIKVGLSTLVQMNKEIAANKAEIAKINKRATDSDVGEVVTLGSGKKSPKKKSPPKKKAPPKKK